MNQSFLKTFAFLILAILLIVSPVSATVTKTETTDGDYTIVKFTTDLAAGGGQDTTTWDADAAGATEVEYLIVGGGAGGGLATVGAGYGDCGGGGGAGELKTNTGLAVSGVITIKIGAGGVGSTVSSSTGGAGSNSQFSDLISVGGGGGGSYANRNGSSGGSGGGAGRIAYPTAYGGAAGSGTAGNDGGSTTAVLYCGSAAGGGGAGSVGGSVGTSHTPGNGGDGIASSITGLSLYYAGGGGGGGDNNAGTTSTGGSGVGGDGDGGSPTQHTGSGGGGGGFANIAAGDGANGVVIIRYLTPGDITPPQSISMLTNDTTKCEEIKWNWTNPTDADYSHLYVLKNNVWLANYTNSTTSVNWTGLTGSTAYTFSSHTVDLAGNMNQTWVNQTATPSTCPTPTPTPTPTATPTPVPCPTDDFPWCNTQDVWLYNASSDIAGFYNMYHMPEMAAQHAMFTEVSSSTGERTIGEWLTPDGSPDAETLAPGLWRFRTYAYASSTAGTNTIHFYVFNRSAGGTQTDIFYGEASIRDDIDSLSPQEYLLSYAKRNYTTFFAGDRLGIRVNASTDSAAARIIGIQVGGNTNATMMSIGHFICCYGAVTTTTTPYPVSTIPNLPVPSKNPEPDYWLIAIIAAAGVFIIWRLLFRK